MYTYNTVAPFIISTVFLFQFYIIKWNDEMSSKFSLLPEEIDSTRNINTLAVMGLLVLTILPIFQFTMAYLYIRYGHPWSRITEDLSLFPKSELTICKRIYNKTTKIIHGKTVMISFIASFFVVGALLMLPSSNMQLRV